VDSVLIVGGGAAGLAAAETLRSEGYAGALTMVCDEPELPYDRPPLSKQVLTGAWNAERTRFREAGHYAELGVRLVRGRAGALDADGRTVYLSDGYPLRFDGLVIATGVRPRRLPTGHELAGVHVLRDHPDAAALRAAFAEGPRVAIVGGGFLGLEVAAAARGLGLDVTVIEPLAQPMVRQVGPAIGAEVARLHREHGVDLRTGVGVSRLLGDRDAPGDTTGTGRTGTGRTGTGRTGTGRTGTAAAAAVSGVALTDGSVVPADCVLVAIGAVPATGWLGTSGLAIGDGVECDEYCRAAPGIYAAGDVASWVNPRYQRRMRIEHRMNATEQGAAAAVNLLKGDVRPFAPLPYFWSDQYNVKLQVHGHPTDGAEIAIEDGSPADGKFVAVYREDGAPTAVLGWNSPARLVRFRKTFLG
jgi:3-phenylpropionate/trans-cinnamate dioxygenase ferredoxin reductase component